MDAGRQAGVCIAGLRAALVLLPIRGCRQLWNASVVVRTMRQLAISVLSVLILSLVAIGSSAASTRSARPTTCQPAKSQILLADQQAELYIVKERRPHAYEAESVVRGCAHGQRRSYLLGEAEEHLGSSGGAGSSGVELETLAGPVVAYEKAYGSEQNSLYEMVVRNLVSGRVLHKVITSRPVKPGAIPIAAGPLTALVVKRDGAVAWIVETGYPVEYRVYAIDKSGTRSLASGADINPASLALAGTLYWTQAGKPATTSLD